MKKIKTALLSAVLIMTFAFVFNNASVDAATTEQTLTLNGGYLGGEIKETEDVQLFKFVIPADGKVTISFQNMASENMRCYLKTADMETLEDDWLAGYGPYDPRTMSWTCNMSKGTYYAMIRSNVTMDAGEEGIVRAKVDYQNFNLTEIEPNDTFEQAMSLNNLSSVRGMYTITNGIDFYKIDLARISDLKLNVNMQGTNGSILLDVYNTNFEKVVDKQISYWHNRNIVLEDMPAGSCYIRVEAYGSGVDFYNLTWQYNVIPVTKITLNKTSAALNIKKSTTLTATQVLPSDATNKAVTWSSSNNSVATVDGTGKVTAKRAGRATITATAADGSGITASCNITVKPNAPKITSLKNGKKYKKKYRYVQIKFKKQSGASGYQIVVSKYKNKKYTTLKSLTKTTYKFKALKGKTYYYKVRAYVKDASGKKVYGKYSSPKKIKIKK